MSERWRRYLRFWGPDVDADIDDELRYHLDLRTEAFVEQGLSRADARHAALDSFGDLDAVTRALRRHDRQKLRNVRRADMIQDFAQDFRYAVRGLRAERGFAAAVIVVLALGIGANTAVFSAIDAAFFRPLPFPHAEQLVSVSNVDIPFEAAQGRPQTSASLADFIADSSAFAHVAAYATGGLNLTGGDDAERVVITYVSSGFFPTLERAAELGRVPSPEEFAKNGPNVVVLSHGLWLRQFGGRHDVLGRVVELNSKSYRVIGVMPADVAFPGGTDVWIPLQLPFGFDIMDAFRNFLPSLVVARLAPGVTPAQAAEHALAIHRRYPLSRSKDLTPAKLVRPLQVALVGDRKAGLLILAGSAVLLLLIACANVTNLLLSRAAARQREISIRAVLGATRARIVRQLAVESLLLAVAGGFVAVGVALLAVRGLAASLPERLSAIAPPRVDARVLLFTLVVALVTSLVFGIAPALGASKSDAGEAMKRAGAGSGGSRRRTHGARAALAIAEVALAVMLLVGAGLMVESLATLLRTDSGLRAEHVVTGRLVFSGSRYFGAARKSVFFNDVIARLKNSAGIDAAAAVSALPMDPARGIALRVAPDDAANDSTREGAGLYLMATPGYFATMGVRLRGADLPAVADSTRPVAVINEALAHTLWPSSEAIGKRLRLGPFTRTVIGVVADIRTDGLDTPAVGQIYLPMSEQSQAYASIVARGTGDPIAMLARIRDAVRAVDPLEPVYALQPMTDVIGANVAPRRTNTILLTLLGVLAVALAAVGVFAVLAYGVTQRTREIGVRVALGAQRSDVLRLIMREGFGLTSTGIAIGLAAALALARFVSSVLYGVSPHDARVFIAAPLVLGLVAAAATFGPALRATRVDPLTALRAE